jgi:hypothetical protein
MWLREINTVAVLILRYSKLVHLLVSWFRKTFREENPNNRLLGSRLFVPMHVGL